MDYLYVYSIKDYIKGNVQFIYYRNKELWYSTNNGFKFPIPIEDCGDAMFLREDKGILYMRWIKKQLQMIEKEKK